MIDKPRNMCYTDVDLEKTVSRKGKRKMSLPIHKPVEETHSGTGSGFAAFFCLPSLRRIMRKTV
jgi:hypothetical protein